MFLIFGGVVFFIAVRYMVVGADMIGQLRIDGIQLSGAIAMPLMIGPVTISTIAGEMILKTFEHWLAESRQQPFYNVGLLHANSVRHCDNLSHCS